MNTCATRCGATPSLKRRHCKTYRGPKDLGTVYFGVKNYAPIGRGHDASRLANSAEVEPRFLCASSYFNLTTRQCSCAGGPRRICRSPNQAVPAAGRFDIRGDIGVSKSTTASTAGAGMPNRPYFSAWRHICGRREAFFSSHDMGRVDDISFGKKS